MTQFSLKHYLIQAASSNQLSAFGDKLAQVGMRRTVVHGPGRGVYYGCMRGV